MAALTRPATWRAVSTLLLLVGVVGLILGETWGWFALIASGVTFTVELVLALTQRGGGTTRL